MQSLAAFHARWWQAEKKPPLQWVSNPGRDYFGLMKNMLIMAVKKGLPTLEVAWGDAYAPILAMKPLIMDKLKWYMKVSLRSPPPPRIFHIPLPVFSEFPSPVFSALSFAAAHHGQAQVVHEGAFSHTPPPPVY
jgi:hypothetical protein